MENQINLAIANHMRKTMPVEEEKQNNLIKDQLQSTLSAKKANYAQLTLELKKIKELKESDILTLENSFKESDAKKTLVIPFISTLAKTTELTEDESLSWEQASLSQYGEGAVFYWLNARNLASTYVPGASYFGSLVRAMAGNVVAGPTVSPTDVMQKLRKIVNEQKNLPEKKMQYVALQKEIVNLEKEIEARIEPQTFSKPQKIKIEHKPAALKPTFNSAALEKIAAQDHREQTKKQEDEKLSKQEQRHNVRLSTFFGGSIGLVAGFYIGFLLSPMTLGISVILGPILGALLGGALTYYSCQVEDTSSPPNLPPPAEVFNIYDEFDIPTSPIYVQLGISPTLSPSKENQKAILPQNPISPLTPNSPTLSNVRR